MKKLLIATSNPGKRNEIKKAFHDFPIEILDLSSVSVNEKPQETGLTFEENALIKARFYALRTHLPAIADDGGFEIDALNGEPGVKSHRWIDPKREAEDEELIKFTLLKMKDLPLEKRGAQLRLVMAIVFPDGHEFTVEDKVRGIVPLKPSPSRTLGFPYRSLLFLPEINKFYNEHELTPEENLRFNHRLRAVEQLKPLIRQALTS